MAVQRNKSANELTTIRKEYIQLLYGRFYPVIVTVRYVCGKLYIMFEQMSPEWCKTIEYCEDMTVVSDNNGFSLQERDEFRSFITRHLSLMKDRALGKF